MGNESRYDEQFDQELIEAGFVRYGKYLEYANQLENIIEWVRERVKKSREFWERQGYTCRRATRADYPDIRRLWDAIQTGDDYVFSALTDAELEEMEQHGRCIVICDSSGKLSAWSLYVKKNTTCYSYVGGTSRLGLAGWAGYEKYLAAYDEGCKTEIVWAREDNKRSRGLNENTSELTGKYFWQFVYRKQG